MDYWAQTMQDDAYLISAVGWQEGARPREIQHGQKQGRQTRLARIARLQAGKRRFKSDLNPCTISYPIGISRQSVTKSPPYTRSSLVLNNS
jgi:hypothetical protein